jgi:catechol 2,3-dioxygenase-like lactoylglutathione lyase family enzyme
LKQSLSFYEDRLGFSAVRTPNRGVVAEVVESARGQRLELVEGGPSPAGLTFVVDDLERWGQHLGSLDIAMDATDSAIEISDPDGLRLRFEQG